MLIKDDEMLERLSSPLNLMNRMRSNGAATRNKAMGLFGLNQQKNPSSPNSPSSFKPIFTSPVDKTGEIPETPTIEADEILPPAEIKADDLIDNADSKIELAHAHNDALGVLNKAIKRMGQTVEDIDPEKLPSVINSVSKVVEGIRKERAEAAKAKSGKEVHLHFYTPTQKALTDYEVVEVG